MGHLQWRQTDQSISAMALVVFCPAPNYRTFMLVFSFPKILHIFALRPVGTGDPETSLAPLIIGLDDKGLNYTKNCPK